MIIRYPAQHDLLPRELVARELTRRQTSFNATPILIPVGIVILLIAIVVMYSRKRQVRYRQQGAAAAHSDPLRSRMGLFPASRSRYDSNPPIMPPPSIYRGEGGGRIQTANHDNFAPPPGPPPPATGDGAYRLPGETADPPPAYTKQDPIVREL